MTEEIETLKEMLRTERRLSLYGTMDTPRHQKMLRALEAGIRALEEKQEAMERKERYRNAD